MLGQGQDQRSICKTSLLSVNFLLPSSASVHSWLDLFRGFVFVVKLRLHVLLSICLRTWFEGWLCRYFDSFSSINTWTYMVDDGVRISVPGYAFARLELIGEGSEHHKAVKATRNAFEPQSRIRWSFKQRKNLFLTSTRQCHLNLRMKITSTLDNI